ncbi:MAG: 3'-5' exoribonuclease YhaM family protein [Fimbriiglobus sp.]
MSKAKPKPVLLSEVPVGVVADFFAMLAEKTKQSTRDGKPFYQCRFQDSRRSVTVAIWSDAEIFATCEKDWAVGGYYKVRGSYFVHEKYGPQIELQQIREVRAEDTTDGFRETDMLERSRFSSEELFTEVRQLAEGIDDLALRTLTVRLLDDHAERLKQLPASDKRFYPYPGGWLEHVRNVARVCLDLVRHYEGQYPEIQPKLNRDVLLAGALLHDLGRVAELHLGVAGAPAEMTVAGRVIGYIQLGRDLVRDAAKAAPELHPESLLLLEHMILSHLSLPEWGSPRLPVAPEVLILHHADDLDAKLEMYARCFRKDTNPSDFTDRDPILGKPLWKRREV